MITRRGIPPSRMLRGAHARKKGEWPANPDQGLSPTANRIMSPGCHYVATTEWNRPVPAGPERSLKERLRWREPGEIASLFPQVREMPPVLVKRLEEVQIPPGTPSGSRESTAIPGPLPYPRSAFFATSPWFYRESPNLRFR